MKDFSLSTLIEWSSSQRTGSEEVANFKTGFIELVTFFPNRMDASKDQCFAFQSYQIDKENDVITTDVMCQMKQLFLKLEIIFSRCWIELPPFLSAQSFVGAEVPLDPCSQASVMQSIDP